MDMKSGEIDLDALSDKVERAAALLTLCQNKLSTTETKVKKVVADLSKIAAPDPTDEDPAQDEDNE